MNQSSSLGNSELRSLSGEPTITTSWAEFICSWLSSKFSPFMVVISVAWAAFSSFLSFPFKEEDGKGTKSELVSFSRAAWTSPVGSIFPWSSSPGCDFELVISAFWAAPFLLLASSFKETNGIAAFSFTNCSSPLKLGRSGATICSSSSQHQQFITIDTEYMNFEGAYKDQWQDKDRQPRWRKVKEHSWLSQECCSSWLGRKEVMENWAPPAISIRQHTSKPIY